MPTYSQPQPIPVPTGGSTRRSPSTARSPYGRHARDRGATTGGGAREWSSPFQRPRSSASHSSGSSSLLFPMDPERGSSSSASSSRHGSAEPPFLYDVPHSPNSPQADWPVCPLCRQMYYGAPAPAQPSRGRSPRQNTALCPVCQREAWQREQHARRRPPESDFSPARHRDARWENESQSSRSTYRQGRAAPEARLVCPSSHGTWPHSDVSIQRSYYCTAPSTHVIGRPFPSYGGPTPPHRPSQPYPMYQTGPWTDPGTLPPATPFVGAYHPQYQLPQLITQLHRRPAPASDVSRAHPGDPFGAASAPTFSHFRR